MPVPGPDVQPFGSSFDHLIAELERIDLLVRVQVTRMRAILEATDPFQGLYISGQDLERLLTRPVGSEPWFNAPHPVPPAEVADALGALRSAIDRRIAVTTVPLRLVDLARRFSLEAVELDLLLIAIAPELDLRFERLFGWLQDDVSRRRPSVDLALQLLFASPAARADARRHVTPGAPLLARRLLSVDEDPARPGAPLLARSLRVEPDVVLHLLGQAGGTQLLEGCASLVHGQARLEGLLLPEDTRAALGRLASRIQEEPLFLSIGGPRGAGRRSVARAMAARLGRPLLEIDLSVLLAPGRPALEGVRLALRDAALNGAIPCWMGLEALTGSRGLAALVVAESLSASPLALGTHERPWEAPAIDGQLLEIQLPRHDFAGRRELWRRALGGADDIETPLLDDLAAGYRMGGDRIRLAVSSARGRARWRAGTLASPTRQDVLEGARARAEAPTHGLAQRVSRRQSWEDLVLPGRALRQLKDISARVRHRATVQGAWGLGEAAGRGQGLHVLFAGPSGTGKTMAAGIIARELGVELLRVDLSQVVSKYIGETEKHLSEVFDAAEAGGAVLFFDEADALFGKRSAVHDAHDRYANIQVSYLLQRMEDFEGLSVLATNLRANLDDAFLRRLSAIIEFPLPDEHHRQQLWRKTLRSGAPISPDVDIQYLVRFPLSGGGISNVMTSAAYRAVDAGSAVGMEHLALAVADELRKMGRPCLRDDFGEWFRVLDTD